MRYIILDNKIIDICKKVRHDALRDILLPEWSQWPEEIDDTAKQLSPIFMHHI
jgi:hypothetical protein